MVYDLKDGTIRDLKAVGGKAKALMEMTAAGFPVPEGFVLPVNFFDSWLEDIKSTKAWSEFLTSQTKENCDRLKALARGCALDSAQKKRLDEAVGGFASGSLFAVRSSSPEEDLGTASFAGEYKTTLGVPVETLEKAIIESFASIFDNRVTEYKKRNNMSMENPRIAILVQKQIDSDASGVGFSQNPQNGRSDEVMINANYGLGETVVSGQVTPDIYVVRDRKIIRKKIADKHMALVLGREGGTEEIENANPQGETLSDSQIIQLGDLINKVERHYGKPMDIEWAVENGEIYLLQARPITTTKTSFKWDVEDLGRGTIYAHAGIAESMPTPLSPLYADFTAIHVPYTLYKLMERMLGEGNAESMRDTRFVTVNGYGYYGMRVNMRFMWPVVRRVRLLMSLFNEHPVWVEKEELPRIKKRLAKMQETDLKSVENRKLIEMAHELEEMICRYYTFCQIYLAQAYKSEGLFNRYYDRKIKKKTHIPSHVFMMGEESLPILADQALFALAQWVKEDQKLSRLLMEAKTIETVLADDRPELADFIGRFNEHLSKHGHMIYDLDFSMPTPADHPQPIFEALKIYMADEAVNPLARQRGMLSKREAAEKKVRAAVSPSRYKKFKRMLDDAREMAPHRENGLANLGLCQPFLRRVLIEMGERLRSANVVKEAEDVFWLHLDELDEFANGEWKGDRLDEVNDRKALNKAQGKVTAPFVLPKDAKMLGFSLQGWLPKEMDEDADAKVFEGLGVSGGRVTGKARVIHSAEDFDQMRQGEILVTAMTTPAWTPLFIMAKGIVTDFGGPLSHSSIVAREYGIPAVLGTGGTSKVIKSGQTITVDGDNGVVKIIERERIQ